MVKKTGKYLLRAMFIGLLVIFVHFFSKNLPALLASEHKFSSPFKLMVLGLLVALGAVEPLFAAWGADSYLGV